jgi:hypothetical protein
VARSGMHSIIRFVEIENRIVSAVYRCLMIKAKVLLVDKSSGEALADPVVTITSPMPNGTLRITLPDSVEKGLYFLKVLNANGEYLVRSADFMID